MNVRRSLKAVALVLCIAVGAAALWILRSPMRCEQNTAFYLRGTDADCQAVNRAASPLESQQDHLAAKLTP